MFCPECEGEFRDEITRCPDCEVELVPRLIEPDHDSRPLVEVFATGDPALLPVARSLLDETDIPYVVKGEETVGLFPAAAGGLAIDPKGRAAQILVAEARAAEAKELLSDLEGAEDSASDRDES